MNHPITILIEQATPLPPYRLRVSLLLRNDSAVKLLFPCPEVTSLNLRDWDSHKIFEWMTAKMIQAEWRGFTLDPGQQRTFDLPIQSYDLGPWAEPYLEDLEEDQEDRWCVALPDDALHVDYQFKVGADYLDPDSHWRLPDLQHRAEAEAATVWLGEARSNQIQLVHPFKPVAIAPAWLEWNNGTIPRIAERMHQTDRFEELTILADALEEAGCTDRTILEHCRGPGPHVRGCWILHALRGPDADRVVDPDPD